MLSRVGSHTAVRTHNRCVLGREKRPPGNPAPWGRKGGGPQLRVNGAGGREQHSHCARQLAVLRKRAHSAFFLPSLPSLRPLVKQQGCGQSPGLGARRPGTCPCPLSSLCSCLSSGRARGRQREGAHPCPLQASPTWPSTLSSTHFFNSSGSPDAHELVL